MMPQVGQDIPSARVIEWCKDEGDEVEIGEVVVIVESDKASFEIEAEETGVLLKILHEPDEEVEILKTLGYIGKPGEAIPDERAEAEGQPQVAEAPIALAGHVRGNEVESDRITASPSAQRVAKERGIDLRQVRGTGPGGRITSDDVMAAPAAPSSPAPSAAPEADGDLVPFGKMRQRIADRLTESVRNIPHLHLCLDVDMTDALALRREFNAKSGAHVTITDVVVKACAAALGEFERMNAHGGRDHVVLKSRIHIGLAVATDEGLLVPVIADADRKSIAEIAQASVTLAEHARRGALRSDAVGTFTVSSLGMYGVREFLPIINPPECGILAVGMIEPRMRVFENGFAPRDMMPVVLAADHRAVDGAYAARFLNRVREHLEEAADLFGQAQ